MTGILDKYGINGLGDLMSFKVINVGGLDRLGMCTERKAWQKRINESVEEEGYGRTSMGMKDTIRGMQMEQWMQV